MANPEVYKNSTNHVLKRIGKNELWGKPTSKIEGEFVFTPIAKDSPLDNYIITNGHQFTLREKSLKPNLTTGDFTHTNSRVFLYPVNKRTNAIGKTKRFITSERNFQKKKPIRKMRVIRNTIEYEIVEVTEEENNTFLLVLETR